MKPLFAIALLFVLFSCQKDKTPPPCTGVSMTGERELFVGTWHWYNTRVEEWFDVGPSIFHNYTPQNQQFEYRIIITSDGKFKSFRNDTLLENLTLDFIEYENFVGTNTNVIRFSVDCTSESFSLLHSVSNLSNDTIFTSKYPLNFDDQENHLRSKINYFVKE